METKAHHVFIGLFVLFFIAAIAVSVVWLGRFNDRVSYNFYNIDFVDAVIGLGKNSPVVIKGIKVGRVEKVSLHPDDIGKVRAIVALDDRIVVRESTKVSLSLQGVSGFAVQFSTFDETSEPLVTPEGEDFPTINVARSQISEVLETVPNILRNVNKLIARLDDVIIQNNSTVGKSLEAVEKGLSFLNDRTADIDVILKDVQKITKNSVKVSKDVTLITGNVVTLTNDIGKQVTPMIKELNATIAEYKKLAVSLEKVVSAEGGETASALQKTLQNISKTAESFANASKKFENIVASAAPGVTRFTNKGLKDAETLLKEANQTMRDFNRLIRQIEKDPQRFLLGDTKRSTYRSN